MKKIFRAIGICFLVLVVVGIAMAVRFFTYDPDSGKIPLAKPVVTDTAGKTYLAVVDGDGSTYAVVTDADGNRYAAEYDGKNVGETVGEINDQIDLEDIPGHTKGDAFEVKPSGNYQGSVDTQTTTTRPADVPSTTAPTTQNGDPAISTTQNGNSETTKAPVVTTTSSNELKAYRIEKYSQIFKSGNFLMEFTTDDPELPSVIMATKGGKLYMETAMAIDEGSEPMPMRMIFDEDGTMYLLIDVLKKYSKMPEEMFGEDMDMTDMLKDFTDTGVGEVTVSRAVINGQELICESYINDDGATINYYFDGDVLVRRDVVYSGGSKESVYFTKITTDVPDSYFEIPNGYSYFNLSWLGALM